ncbi:hypothetical protein ARAM_004828 [Aspergillus rambellii]|uniref:SRR1-like domain-containing protein n=1 Tax=Aspergillus rambellii TaxID=308745 RepID=A0A0F8UU98_9EURO|nr:hypothetical protein ARAM_004828 [Aspergillus rambellii]
MAVESLMDEQAGGFTDGHLLSKIQEKLEHLSRLYNSGKPLFPRALLADLDDQIEQGNDEVYIDDLDDVRHAYSLKIPSWCSDFATNYRIGYSSIQNLTCIHPSFPEISLRDNAPVSICYTSSAEFPKSPAEDVRQAFKTSLVAWKASETCKTLERHMSTLSFSTPINKIIGFGLGTLSVLEHDYHSTRSHAQHAAIGSMVETLTRRGINGDQEIKCYAQDPAYNDVDQDLLRSLGIVPLDDPKGFLEIDASTLVFSVSPNIPVKQVVVDVQWPAAMIWNTVNPEENENSRWEKQMRNGEEFWVVPYTTDPDSKRVRKMVEHYTSVSLCDLDEYFGDLTIYVK